MEIKAGLVFIFSFPTEEDKVVAQGLRELHIMHYCSLQSTIQQGTPIKQTMWEAEAPLAPEQQLTRVSPGTLPGLKFRCTASFIFIIT